MHHIVHDKLSQLVYCVLGAHRILVRIPHQLDNIADSLGIELEGEKGLVKFVECQQLQRNHVVHLREHVQLCMPEEDWKEAFVRVRVRDGSAGLYHGFEGLGRVILPRFEGSTRLGTFGRFVRY
jgi:hypothetical protein